MFCYVYLYPNNLPAEIMLQFRTTSGATNRAYWGSDMITNFSRSFVGTIPKAGRWTRLEVSAASLGLQGQTLNGTTFSLFNGWSAWDRLGKYNPDSDADGLPDEWERKYFGNLNQTASGDYDADQLTNLQEYQNSTNPILADSDGDGLTDYQEIYTIGTDPTKWDTDGNGIGDGDEDADGDLATPAERARAVLSLHMTA